MSEHFPADESNQLNNCCVRPGPSCPADEPSAGRAPSMDQQFDLARGSITRPLGRHNAEPSRTGGPRRSGWRLSWHQPDGTAQSSSLFRCYRRGTGLHGESNLGGFMASLYIAAYNERLSAAKRALSEHAENRVLWRATMCEMRAVARLQ